MAFTESPFIGLAFTGISFIVTVSTGIFSAVAMTSVPAKILSPLRSKQDTEFIDLKRNC